MSAQLQSQFVRGQMFPQMNIKSISSKLALTGRPVLSIPRIPKNSQELSWTNTSSASFYFYFFIFSVLCNSLISVMSEY